MEVIVKCSSIARLFYQVSQNQSMISISPYPDCQNLCKSMMSNYKTSLSWKSCFCGVYCITMVMIVNCSTIAWLLYLVSQNHSMISNSPYSKSISKARLSRKSCLCGVYCIIMEVIVNCSSIAWLLYLVDQNHSMISNPLYPNLSCLILKPACQENLIFA